METCLARSRLPLIPMQFFSPLRCRPSLVAGAVAALLTLSACHRAETPDAPASAADPEAAADGSTLTRHYEEARTPALAAQAAATSIPSGVLDLLTQAKIPLDDVSLLVVPADGGAPLVNHASSVPRNPASVMKLVTTAAALDVLGPTYTWKTPVWAGGPVQNGVLHGNLYVKGSGDPLLVMERLWMLMRNVRQAGIETIDGDLVLDNTAFEVPQQDPGSFDGKPFSPYNARPDALLVNFKSAVLNFTPDPAQQVAHVSIDPPLQGVSVPATVPLTHGACANTWQSGLGARLSDPHAITFSGHYADGCGHQIWAFAYPAPNEFAARAVAGMWTSLGGRIQGQVRYDKVPADIVRKAPLAESVSPTVPEVIRSLNKHSNNVMAQQVFLSMGLRRAGVGNMSTSTAAVQDWWRGMLGATPMPDVDNGAGLSRSARISASSLGAMLQAVWRSPNMPEFMESLPIIGVDGTLRRSRIADRGAAHLKTGTLRDASALAGYVLAKDGRRYVFVAIANGGRALLARPAFEALVDWTVHRPATATAGAPAVTATPAVAASAP